MKKNRRPVVIQYPVGMLEQIDREAKKRYQTRSEFVRAAVLKELKIIESEEYFRES